MGQIFHGSNGGPWELNKTTWRSTYCLHLFTTSDMSIKAETNNLGSTSLCLAVDRKHRTVKLQYTTHKYSDGNWQLEISETLIYTCQMLMLCNIKFKTAFNYFLIFKPIRLKWKILSIFIASVIVHTGEHWFLSSTCSKLLQVEITFPHSLHFTN